MRSLHLVLALYITLTTSVPLNKRQDFFGGDGGGGGGDYSAPLAMDLSGGGGSILASADIAPTIPDPAPVGADSTVSMVEPSVDISSSFTPTNNVIASTPETASSPGAAQGSTLVATTGTEPAPGTAGTPPETAGTPPVTAGTPPETPGTPPVTAGTPPGTAGTPPETAGTPPVTAGTPPVTAGTPPVTAGTPPITAGTPPITAGTPPITAGTPPEPAGTPPGTAETPPVTAGTPPETAGIPPVTAGTPPETAGTPGAVEGSTVVATTGTGTPPATAGTPGAAEGSTLVATTGAGTLPVAAGTPGGSPNPGASTEVINHLDAASITDGAKASSGTGDSSAAPGSTVGKTGDDATSSDKSAKVTSSSSDSSAAPGSTVGKTGNDATSSDKSTEIASSSSDSSAAPGSTVGKTGNDATSSDKSTEVASSSSDSSAAPGSTVGKTGNDATSSDKSTEVASSSSDSSVAPGSTVGKTGNGATSSDKSTEVASSSSDTSSPSYKMTLASLPGSTSSIGSGSTGSDSTGSGSTGSGSTKSGSESQRDASIFNPDGTDKLVMNLISSNELLASSTGSTDGSGSGSGNGSGRGNSGSGSGNSGSGSGSNGTPGTTIQGYQRPPAGLQYLTGSGAGSSANGVTATNAYYRTNTASTGPSLTETLGRNLVTIGSKFLSDMINGDPNKIAAEAANPYNSPAYVAQLQAQQAQQAQIAAASARAAQLQAAARASPVSGSGAYYAAQNGNGQVNVGRVTSPPIGSPTLTPEQLAVRRASIISNYYKNHPSAGIIGTGQYRMQPSTVTTATATPTSTSVPDQVIDPTTGEYVPVSTDSTDSPGTAAGSYSGLQAGSADIQGADTISYPGTTYPGTTYPGTTYPGATSPGTTYPSTSGVTDTSLSSLSSTTCQVTALNAGNCNPNFRNKICDLGCTNNEQAAVAALCQKNSCLVGDVDPTVNYQAIIGTTGFPNTLGTVNGNDLKLCHDPTLNAVGDLCYKSTGRPVALKSSTGQTPAIATDPYGTTTSLTKRRRNLKRKAVSESFSTLQNRRRAKSWFA